ncbi:hypothetical protein BHE74_00022534 [Ensete ventricosum]|uniref:Uncharacterized protein n=1 Tax=Ensete ventricosum TaxID=4639 RepID=A0A444DBZ3_ENSVE|nr:hypothetical protein B296_00027854 [Ensete ventricosum]RWV95693.1 hypothetical protein GW17_00041663 [Ensete ventricosum]RWW69832.1 hypothetical protein BHE74_00022534 [Ensete ventricosum]RZS02871.1 hypothetical protein BHM03_00032977 [Ensete ventricosum]
MAFGLSGYGIQAMLKEGHKHLSGLDEAVLKNIDACKQLSVITRTSLGPNGMNKMVINHLDKLFVTNDAATIVNELEVQHPAAKILVLAGKAQQEEIGDGANLTISFAGELLQNAEELIRMGLHPSEIISGYTKAINKTIEILDELIEKGSETMDVRSKEEVVSRMKAAVASKQFGQEQLLLDQYAIAKFGESFEMVPRTLAENAGLNAMEIISSLYAEHAAGNIKVGIDLEEGVCKDVSAMNVWDLYLTK